MADSKNMAEIKKQHKILKNEAARASRMFGEYLDQTKNKVGDDVYKKQKILQRHHEDAREKLQKFEAKHGLDKYQSKPRKTLKLPKKGGSGVGGGSIKSPDETARGRMSLLKKRQM